MDKHAISIKEKLTVYTSSNTVTLPSSKHNKVYIWGYELCKGSDWNNFLEVVNKLGEENKQLKQQLNITEKALELLKYQHNYYRFVNENTETIDVDLAISKAKEMIKNE